MGSDCRSNGLSSAALARAISTCYVVLIAGAVKTDRSVLARRRSLAGRFVAGYWERLLCGVLQQAICNYSESTT